MRSVIVICVSNRHQRPCVYPSINHGVTVTSIAIVRECKRRCFKNTGPCHLSLRLHGIPLHDARALDNRPTTVVVISNTAVINFGGRRAMWHDLLVRTYGKERVINVLAGSSRMLQHATQSYDFGMFVVRGAVPKQFVEVLEQSVPRTIADVDAVFGSNQSLVGSSKSRFYKTWQAVGVGCSCRYKYDSTNSHPVFKVGAGGEAGDATSWWKKQQPQSVSRCLDTVLNFWNRFGTDKCSPDIWDLFVVNHYCLLGDSIPWHDDDSNLLHAGRDFSADIASITLQNSGILCFMPRKDGTLWQQYRIGNYTRTVDNLISHKMRAAVALHRGDIMLFTGNFQRLMQHKAPSFAKWHGQTADEFMRRYPGRDISEEFEAAKRLSTWGARAVVTCRIIRSHEQGCPWRNLRDSELPVSPRAPPPPPVPALHSVASSSRQAPPPPPDLLVKRIGSGPVVPPPPPSCPPPATQRPARLTVLRGMPEQPTLATTTRGVACSTAALAVTDTAKAASPRPHRQSEASSPVQTRHTSFLFLVLIRFVALISAWLALATALKS